MNSLTDRASVTRISVTKTRVLSPSVEKWSTLKRGSERKELHMSYAGLLKLRYFLLERLAKALRDQDREIIADIRENHFPKDPELRRIGAMMIALQDPATEVVNKED